MSPLLSRRELAYLTEWSARPSRKPLVIRGARQVGKSTLVRQFAQTAGLHLVEINFERDPALREAFVSHDPAEIQTALHLLTGTRILPGKVLLFLDEIQAAPEVLATLRYFYEEAPALHVLAAGSLLDFALADSRFSMPVGRIEYLHLGPMQFEDFLLAMGKTALAEHLQALSLVDIQQQKLLQPLHEKYLRLLRQYWVVGGLPEVVAAYAATGDFAEVHRIQQSVVATFRDDFNKYGQRAVGKLLPLVFDQVPRMVGRKFKYANVSRDHRAAELDVALTQLCMARVAAKVQHTAANGVPLAAEVNQRHFKTLYLDIGLLCAALKHNVLDLDKADLTTINAGALAEQYIGQHLLFGGAYYETPELYCWIRQAKSASAEIDYVIAFGNHVVPVEIKAGTTGTLKSLHQFLKEKKRHFGLRFNADTPSLLHDVKKHTDGTGIEYELLSLPLYLVGQTRRLLRAYFENTTSQNNQ